ncbi:GyrI-like domain-containing protein [Pseudomonas antarctica]|uniref:Bacterial transcription activator, effector binding domain n=1 Tax=Pseudomonas antarctica TaxID=219572 RepID=A0A1H0AFJ9_9PSED|nr:GyrI-like domain-containing protein [Pseudomonas antarctica]KAF2407254.1 bacterial transcription activator, effector binding domain [Pseudomonas antarctica]SDN31773.1 Predicted transcriptional regulator YdeE, contains AraC-type DNA-binding domain [Pseudomonas antarctica]
MQTIKEQQVAAVRISGLKVRTRNADETQPSRAKIGPMWQRFFAEELYQKIPGKQAESAMYGVYSGYESDAQGLFDVTAGVATQAPAAGYESVVIEPGRYLVFEARGPMPDAIISTWQQVWAYFEQPGVESRAFVTDFELYQADDVALIYIGIC